MYTQRAFSKINSARSHTDDKRARSFCRRLTLRMVPLAGVLWAVCWTNCLANESELLRQTCNGTTLLIVRVDGKDFELPPQLQRIAEQDASGAIAELTRMVTQPVVQIRELLQEESAYLALDLPYSPRIHARLHTTTKVPESQFLSLAKTVWPMEIGPAVTSAGWQTISLSSPGAGNARVNSDLLPPQLDRWQAALAETSDFPVQLAIVVPEYVRATFAEIEPELPPMLGGGPAKPLISGVHWLSVGFKPGDATIRIVIQTESTAAAEQVQQYLPRLFQSLLKASQLDQASTATLMAVLGLLQPKVSGQQVILGLADPQQSEALLRLAAATISATTKPMAVSQTQNNLKQLALGMHNYHSAFNALPTYAELKTTGKTSGLSWRVHILPFIEHADLYREFKLDEPWDSPYNLPLLERMPQVFKPVIPVGSTESVKPFHTTYVAPIGEKTVFGQDKPVDFQHITDGTSNTIAFVEVKPEHAIPWTSPEECRYDAEDPAGQLRSINGRVSTAFMDGSVRGIRDDEPASVWNALLSINGSEMVSPR
jgi:hypothetical protein